MSRDRIDECGRAITTRTLSVHETEAEAEAEARKQADLVGLPCYKNFEDGQLPILVS